MSDARERELGVAGHLAVDERDERRVGPVAVALHVLREPLLERVHRRVLVARARRGTPRRPPRRGLGASSGRSAQVTISTPAGGSIAGASIAVRSSTIFEFRPTSRKPRRSTHARLSASSSATVVSSVTQPRSCTHSATSRVERRPRLRHRGAPGSTNDLAVPRARLRVPADVRERGAGILSRPSTRSATPCPRPGASSRRSRRRRRCGRPGHWPRSPSQRSSSSGVDLPDLDHAPNDTRRACSRIASEE